MQQNIGLVRQKLAQEIENYHKELKENLAALNFDLKIKTISPEDARDKNHSRNIDKEAIVGKWPGEETIEELLTMLKEIRK